MKQRGGGTIRLDRLDLKILATLQTAGRISNLELADTVGLSATPCQQRVRRLEAAGYISAYGAQLAIDRICRNIVVFTEITLSNHRREDFLKFEESIRVVDEVIECHLISGGYDYLLKFLTRGVAHYQAVMESILEREIGVAKYFSFIVIKTPFQKRHYPLSKLFGAEHG